MGTVPRYLDCQHNSRGQVHIVSTLETFSEYFFKMGMRLKLPNKEQESCANKMSERSETEEAGESVSEIIEDKCDHENRNLEENSNFKTHELNDVKETEEVRHQKSDDDHEPTTHHSDSNSETGSEDEDDVKDKDSKETSTTEQKSVDERVSGKEDESLKPGDKHRDNRSVDSDLPNSDEIKENLENKKESDEKKEDEEESEKSVISSKLDADALSASLSSSRCLLKRNRDDLDSDDDSEEEEEEPYSKKSHIGEVTPKFVSKLKSTELLASMSSSNKCVLKRGIEKVDKASAEELTDAPESKKSNLSQTPKPEASSSSSNSTNKVETDLETKRKDRLSPAKPSVTPEQENSPEDVTIVPKTLKFPPSSPYCQNQGLERYFTTPSPSILEKSASKSKEEEKEEFKQKIGAKELAGQRQLERKRLNKMLSIF